MINRGDRFKLTTPVSFGTGETFIAGHKGVILEEREVFGEWKWFAVRFDSQTFDKYYLLKMDNVEIITCEMFSDMDFEI